MNLYTDGVLMEAQKFHFDNDFGSGAPRKRLTENDVREAHEKGYALGFKAGQDEQHMIGLMRHVGQLAESLLTQVQAMHSDMEKTALSFALEFGRQIGGAAIARAPLAPIAEAVKQAFEHVQQVPHLAIRVHESLVEDTQNVLKRITAERGFDGQMIVIPEPDMPLGDVLLEWADGGMSRSHEVIEQAVKSAVETWLETPNVQR
jgi:flagellar assembly protein FliH